MTTSLEKMALMSKTLLCKKKLHINALWWNPVHQILAHWSISKSETGMICLPELIVLRDAVTTVLSGATLLCAFPKRRCLGKNRVGLGTKSLINAFQHRVNSCCARVTFSSRFDCSLATLLWRDATIVTGTDNGGLMPQGSFGTPPTPNQPIQPPGSPDHH